MNLQTIHLITAGGTIDKRYNPLSGELDVGPPVAGNILTQAGISPDRYLLTECLRKDSLAMDDADRERLAAQVAASTARCILITHGTDTMGLSAALIETRSGEKTVVLTGAMVPWQIDGSDAEFNVGFAFSAVQTLPAGVYIAMHGRALPHRQHIKDRTQGRFIAM